MALEEVMEPNNLESFAKFATYTAITFATIGVVTLVYALRSRNREDKIKEYHKKIIK